jgi:aldose 1-epimerase
MGFPGTLTATVRYTLQGSSLRLEYSARTTKATVINLTNHSYFNLSGEASGDVLGQRIRLFADRFTPVDETLIPTGVLEPVAGTPLDLREETAIGAHLNDRSEQLERAGGYDHNFVVSGHAGSLREAAFAVDPKSGRTLTVLTTQPGVQFYSGNFLSGMNKGYSGKVYEKHAGFCLETQHFPDSPNQPAFPSTELRPGQVWRSTTVFRFGLVGKR